MAKIMSEDLSEFLASQLTSLHDKVSEYVDQQDDLQKLAAAHKDVLEVIQNSAKNTHTPNKQQGVDALLALPPHLTPQKAKLPSITTTQFGSSHDKNKLAPLKSRRTSVVELTIERHYHEKILKRMASSNALETDRKITKSSSAIFSNSPPAKPTNISENNKVAPISDSSRIESGPIVLPRSTNKVIENDQAIDGDGEEANRQVPVINPDSRVYWFWNALILLLVFWSSISVPVRLAFEVEGGGFVVGFSYFMELCFILDIVVNFFTGYWDVSQGEVIVDVAAIRKHYLHGWFIVDVLSSIPVEMITSGHTSQATNDVALLKILRLLKMFRLVRLLHLKALKDLEYQGYLPPSMIRLFKLVFAFLLATHLVACGYWAVALEQESFWDGSGDAEDMWVPHEKYKSAKVLEQYTEAFYWAMLVFVGSDVAPSNTRETSFTALMMLVGIGVFASVIGSASSLLSNLDATAEQKKSQMDSINHYLKFHSVPKQLRTKIRDYYEYLWISGQSIHDKSLFDQLPESLNLQLDLSLKRKLLEGVAMFRDIQPVSVLAIVRKLKDTIAIPEEVVMRQGEFGDCMYFIKRGRADV
jgi:hypothetical protein